MPYCYYCFIHFLLLFFYYFQTFIPREQRRNTDEIYKKMTLDQFMKHTGLVANSSNVGIFYGFCVWHIFLMEKVKVGVNVKAFPPISRSRFKRHLISLLISLTTIWRFCVNFWVIFGHFGKEILFLKG